MDNLQKAIEEYKNGTPAHKSCEIHKVGYLRFQKALSHLGIKRSLQESKRRRFGVFLNENSFDDLTNSEVLYWIGFIYADGSIYTHQHQISIDQSIDNKNHLEKFSKFLGEGINVRTYPPREDRGEFKNHQGSCIVSFTSTKIRNILTDLGFTTNKSADANPHELLKHSKDFWRGVVDGDGWIYISDKRSGTGLSGTKNTLLSFVTFLNNNGIPTLQNPRKDTRKNVHTLNFVNRQATKIVDLLYKDSTVYLDRKYKIYQNWIKE